MQKKWKRAGAGAKGRLREAHAALHGKANGDYKLKLYFATTGKVTEGLKKKAGRVVSVFPDTKLEVLDRLPIIRLLSDWLEGAAPPLPELDLTVDGPHTLPHHESHEGLEAWVFSTTSEELCRLYKQADERLFARNVRGYLGADRTINTEIRRSAKGESRTLLVPEQRHHDSRGRSGKA